MQYSMVFDERRPDDLSAEMHGVSVLVDPFSADYLRGTVVDFSDSLTNGGLGRIGGTWGSTTATTAAHQNDTYFAATTGRLNASRRCFRASGISKTALAPFSKK